MGMMTQTPSLRFLLSLLLLPAFAVAQSSSWTESSGGDYGVDAHWSDDVPDATDGVAVFDLSSTYTVDFPTSHTADRLSVIDGVVTFDFAADQSYALLETNNSFTSGDVGIMVGAGSGESATLVLAGDGDGLAGVAARIGTDHGGQGHLDVNGNAMDLSGFLQVAAAGNGSLLVQNGGSVTTQALRVSQEHATLVSVGTVTVTGSGSSLETTGQSGGLGMIVGFNAQALVNVLDGGRIETSRLVFSTGSGTGPTGDSQMTISGADAELVLTQNDQNSLFGTTSGRKGFLTIEEGGALRVTGTSQDLVFNQTADVTVTGVGSLLAARIVQLSGTMLVEEGANVTATSLEVRNGGELTLSGGGNGHRLNTSPSGTLSVRDGTATVDAGATGRVHGLIVGNLANQAGVLNVSGADSNLRSTNWAMFGRQGAGEVNVTDGGSIDVEAQIWMGRAFGNTPAGGNTVVNISGANSLLRATQNTIEIGFDAGRQVTVNVSNGGEMRTGNNSALTVGVSGTGILNITDGGEVVSGPNGIIGSLAGSTGTVTISGTGSSWSIASGAVTVGGAGTGTLIVRDGGTFGGGLTVGENGTLTGGGGSIIGTVTNSGLVAPGDSPGTMTIFVDYNQTGTGTIEMEIGGLTAGTEYDQLNVFGDATFGGTLSILSYNDFMPSVGQTFQLFSVNQDIFGAFDTIDAFALDSGLFWDFDNLYIDGSVSVIPEPATVAFLLGLLALAGVIIRRRQKGRALRAES